MIGQERLINKFSKGPLPRFMLFISPPQSGKRLLAKEIAKQQRLNFMESGNKVLEIREVIELAHRQAIPTLIYFPQGGKMSKEAKNAMLKFTEEPPRNCYIALAVNHADEALDTIRSRACMVRLDPYATSNLKTIAEMHGIKNEVNFVISFCETPGQIIQCASYDLKEFYDYVVNVVKNVGRAPGANALKIASRIAFKSGEDGWDYKIFMRAVSREYFALMDTEIGREDAFRAAASIQVTSLYGNEMEIKGVHKPSSFDMWILELRSIWEEINE